jgi:hypothetical protein
MSHNVKRDNTAPQTDGDATAIVPEPRLQPVALRHETASTNLSNCPYDTSASRNFSGVVKQRVEDKFPMLVCWFRCGGLVLFWRPCVVMLGCCVLWCRYMAVLKCGFPGAACVCASAPVRARVNGPINGPERHHSACVRLHTACLGGRRFFLRGCVLPRPILLVLAMVSSAVLGCHVHSCTSGVLRLFVRPFIPASAPVAVSETPSVSSLCLPVTA